MADKLVGSAKRSIGILREIALVNSAPISDVHKAQLRAQLNLELAMLLEGIPAEPSGSAVQAGAGALAPAKPSPKG